MYWVTLVYRRWLSTPVADAFIVGGITVKTRYLGRRGGVDVFETRVSVPGRRARVISTYRLDDALAVHAKVSHELTPPL